MEKIMENNRIDLDSWDLVKTYVLHLFIDPKKENRVKTIVIPWYSTSELIKPGTHHIVVRKMFQCLALACHSSERINKYRGTNVFENS